MIDTGSVTIGWGEDGDEGVRKEDRIVHIVSGCGEIVLVGGKTGEDEKRSEETAFFPVDIVLFPMTVI